jgi:hypothetical protein
VTYPFVQARYFTRGGMVQPRAIVLHMAEGGGTVEWLTHPTSDNSSHFVIEYSGRVVQMVADGDADHSLHTARPSGPPGPGDCGMFSLDIARDLLGDGIYDPNAYLIAVEIEGYAAAGPNPAQTVALRNLIDDLLGRHPSLRGLLGHRDFQNYKACPGCHVFDKFGHGAFIGAGPLQPAQETADMFTLAIGRGRVLANTKVYPLPDSSSAPVQTFPVAADITWLGSVPGWYAAIVTVGGALRAAWVPSSRVTVAEPLPGWTQNITDELLTGRLVTVATDCDAVVGSALESYRERLMLVPTMEV